MSDHYEIRKQSDDDCPYAVFDSDGEFVCADETYADALRALATLAESGRWHLGMGENE